MCDVCDREIRVTLVIPVTLGGRGYLVLEGQWETMVPREIQENQDREGYLGKRSEKCLSVFGQYNSEKVKRFSLTLGL